MAVFFHFESFGEIIFGNNGCFRIMMIIMGYNTGCVGLNITNLKGKYGIYDGKLKQDSWGQKQLCQVL